MITLLFSLFLSSYVYSAEWKSSFGAEMEAEGLYWTEGLVTPDTKKFRGVYTLKAPTTIRRGRSLRFRALPLVQWDPGNSSKVERFYWDFPEGFVQWQGLPWTIQLGMNTFTWGDTDIFNPLDVVNARRFFDPFRSEKMGAPSLTVKRDFESFFIEAVYIPEQRKTLLPGENSRWLPREVFKLKTFGSSGETRLLLPTNLRYRFLPDLEVDNALKNNAALRVKFRLPDFDWTLMAFEGAAGTPDVRPADVTATPVAATPGFTSSTFQLGSDVGLQAAFYPVRVTGTSFTWVAGPILVKGAAAYTHVKNRRFDLPSRLWENALALESTFGLGKGSVTALIQGSYINRASRVAETNSVSLARMFDEGIMGALRWSPNEVVTATASYLRDMKFEGSLWHLDSTYKIRDGWRAKVSADLLDGPTETPLGTYRKNDRVTVSILAQY
jgi:hypothetical protein